MDALATVVLAEEFGRAEGEEAAHAGGQCAQRADLCGEFADGMDLTDRVKGRRHYLLRFGAGARGLAGTGLTTAARSPGWVRKRTNPASLSSNPLGCRAPLGGMPSVSHARSKADLRRPNSTAPTASGRTR